MPPSKSRESAEIGVGRDHRAAMLHGNRRVLGVSNQLSGGAGCAAKSFEYVQVIGARAYDPRGRTFHERRHKCKRLIKRRWWVEDSAIGYDADEAG